MPDASLRIQVVLHHQAPDGVARLVRSLVHSGDLARRAGVVGAVSIRLGDCGADAPSTTAEQVAELAGELGADLSLTVFDDNLGHGGGQNALAADLTEDLLLVVNPDAVAEPRLVTQLARRFDDPQVGIVEARQVPFEHPKAYEPDGTTSWASMACAMLRGSVVREVGLFDADTFFLHADDVDLSWRVRAAGWDVVHEPTARVFHDKQVGEFGYVEPSSAERLHGPLGLLLLAHKWSLDAEVSRLRRQLQAGDDDQQEALRRFDERVASGQVPERREPGDVAVFVDGIPGRHRF